MKENLFVFCILNVGRWCLCQKKNVDLTNQTTIMFQISLIIIIMTFIHSLVNFFSKMTTTNEKRKGCSLFSFRPALFKYICVTRNGRITKTIDCWLLFKKMILSFCKRIVSCFSWFDFSLLLRCYSLFNQSIKTKKNRTVTEKTKMSIKCMNWMNSHQDEYDDDDHWLNKQDYVWNIHLLWWYFEHIAYIDWTHS